MPLRLAITKQSGQHETMVVDICQWNPVTGEIVHKDISEMQEIAEQALKIADLRDEEMNLRMLEAYGLEAYCDLGTWTKITQVLSVLSGQLSIATLKARWQSEVEETFALEQQRREALYTVSEEQN